MCSAAAEELVLLEALFVETSLRSGIIRPPDRRRIRRAPQPVSKGRREAACHALFPNWDAIGGEPADVGQAVAAHSERAGASHVPDTNLFIRAEPGQLESGRLPGFQVLAEREGGKRGRAAFRSRRFAR